MADIKGILFDMDGVLIDAKEWHYKAFNKALSLFGFEINQHEHLLSYDGLPTSRKLELLSIERGLPYELHNFINCLKQSYTLQEVYLNCKPVFSHEYALSKLKKQGYSLGVCSNSIKETVEIMLDRASLIRYFDVLLSNQDVSKPKPDPEIYLKGMAMLSLRPSETLIIEDNDHGIRAAIESGAYVFRVESVHDVTYSNITKYISTL